MCLGLIPTPLTLMILTFEVDSTYLQATGKYSAHVTHIYLAA